jgi:hypothetical protein
VVHAAHEAAADEAVRALQAAFTLADAAPARLPAVQAVIG